MDVLELEFDGAKLNTDKGKKSTLIKIKFRSLLFFVLCQNQFIYSISI